MEANDHIRQQELIKQCQNIDKLEGVIKNLSDQLTDQENRSRRDNLRIIGLPGKKQRQIEIWISYFKNLSKKIALMSLNKKEK